MPQKNMSTALAPTIPAAKELLTKAATEFASRIPASVPLAPDQFVSSAITTFAKNPALLRCTKESVFQALYSVAALGLDFQLNRAHLVPFGNVCTPIIGYAGLRELAIRSGFVLDAYAFPVYENDACDFGLGDEPFVRHKPSPPAVRGNLIACYMVVHQSNGRMFLDWMWREEIDAIRHRSRASKKGPWVTDYVEMAKKTVLRRGLKQMPLTPELSKAMEMDIAAMDEFRGPPTLPGDATPAPTGRTQAEKLRNAAAPKPDTPPEGPNTDAGSVPEGEVGESPIEEPEAATGEDTGADGAPETITCPECEKEVKPGQLRSEAAGVIFHAKCRKALLKKNEQEAEAPEEEPEAEDVLSHENLVDLQKDMEETDVTEAMVQRRYGKTLDALTDTEAGELGQTLQNIYNGQDTIEAAFGVSAGDEE